MLRRSFSFNVALYRLNSRSFSFFNEIHAENPRYKNGYAALQKRELLMNNIHIMEESLNITNKDPSHNEYEDCDNFIKVASSCAYVKLRDVNAWRILKEKFFQMLPYMGPSDIPHVLYCFRALRINDAEILQISSKYILNSVDKLSFFDVSVLMSAYSGSDALDSRILLAVLPRIIQTANAIAFEESQNGIEAASILVEASRRHGEKRRVKGPSEELQWQKRKFESSCNIVGAYAKAGIDDEELFSAMALFIGDGLLNSQLRLKTSLILKALVAYTRFSYSQKDILLGIAVRIPQMKLDDEQLNIVHKCFRTLRFTDATCEKIFAMRAGVLKSD